MDIRIDLNRFLIKIWSDVKGWLGAWPGAWLRRRWQAYIARRTESQALPRGLAVTHVRSGDQWRIPGKCPGQEVAGPTLAPMVWVPPPPGEFIMGDDKPGGGAIQKVRLSKGFYLMKALVSNAQYTHYLNELHHSGTPRRGWARRQRFLRGRLARDNALSRSEVRGVISSLRGEFKEDDAG